MCKKLVFFVTFVFLLGISSVGYASPQTITPGVLWYDSSSNVLSAHGGGILKEGNTYYWFGEYKDCDPNNVIKSFMGRVTHQFVAHTCYSSTDFVNWTFENYVLTQQAEGDLGPSRVVERPKVIYNDSTGMYVMYMHIDNQRYGDRRVGVATCPTVNGNYTYQGSFQPLGNDSKDMTIFKDDDGKAYLISGSINIYQLTDDYLDVNNLVVTIDSSGSEAPAMFKVGGTYYLLNSHSTWWDNNDNYYHTAPSIEGPWTYQGDFTPGSSTTWDSQTTFVQAIQGSSTTSYVFMADRWAEGDFCNSMYIWLPLIVDGTSLTVDWYDQWTIDAQTGEWAPGGEPDVDPPTPDPMTWATVPYATGPTSIAMVATTASDSSPPVEYYFDCTTAGGHDSGWQTSTSYEDTGLQCETQYTYRVQARDSVPNTGSFSTSESATTDTCPSEPDMYVNDIAMGCSQQAVFHRVTATVWIKDDTSTNVEGATVYVEWTGDVSGTDSGTTLADGTVYFESAKVKNGLTATCCVTDVVKTGYVYNSSLNNETCDSNTCP